MNLIQLIGIAASVCTAVSLLPQLVKILREKKADAVSLPMLLILFTGVALWVVYGVMRKDMIIVVSNSVSALLNIAILTASLLYRKKK